MGTEVCTEPPRQRCVKSKSCRHECIRILRRSGRALSRPGQDSDPYARISHALGFRASRSFTVKAACERGIQSSQIFSSSQWGRCCPCTACRWSEGGLAERAEPLDFPLSEGTSRPRRRQLALLVWRTSGLWRRSTADRPSHTRWQLLLKYFLAAPPSFRSRVTLLHPVDVPVCPSGATQSQKTSLCVATGAR